MVWIGLDIGTQSARAMVVAADGEVVGRGAVALRSVRDGGRHEQDPPAWWEAVAGASRAALQGVAPERVRGVATCATSGTILLVDRLGKPLTPGLMYDDARAGEEAAPRRGGGGAPSGGGAPRDARAAEPPALRRLRWMLRAWPELARGSRLAHQADVITRGLVGAAVPSDSSHALKTGYDQEGEAWSGAALDLPAGLLPDVVRSGSRLGEVCAAAAAETGIPEGTPVIAGMTDGCAAQFAAGALREGDWNSVLGTTLVLKGRSEDLVLDPAGVLYSHRAPDGGWLPGGASSTGAGVLTEHFPGRDLDDLGRGAQAFEDTRVLAYPLVSRGERFPFAAPDAEAFVLGQPAGEAELFAALLHGVAFVERLCFDYAGLLGAPTQGELTLTGGGTRSRDWCQLRADVLGRPVRLVEQSEAAFGMAVLAASADRGGDLADTVVGMAARAASAGRGGDLAATAARMVRTREVIEPRPERAARLTEHYLRLVGELERRGWLGAPLAEHARSNLG